ncbi:MAG: DNA polymerase IV [Deferribacteres bacterium]|nr:DNA polymerase IV [candidate division KSB1 bacterium]MCB9501280.1 DNA polymerase IV [Deferribacteres bacterium]
MASSAKKIERVIMHLDMDAFFAAIEQLDNPEYRGKPVVVGADPQGGKGRGVVSTASYEARTYGIHSALPISQAYRLCPHAIFVRGRIQRYVELSRKIIEIIKNYSPVVEQISIDEAFVDISGSLRLLGSAKEIAVKLKADILQQTGLKASVGIAPNKFIAKIASDLEKPDGLTICEQGHEKAFLAPLPIRKLWGVGARTEERLQKLGIHTIGDIAAFDVKKLTEKLGVWGFGLWKLANGIDNRKIGTQHKRKSISEERTFNEDVADYTTVEKTLFKIADELSRTMRRKALKGRTITLKLRLEGFDTFTRSKKLTDYVQDADSLRAVVVGMFRQFPINERKVRLVGIAVSQLNTLGGEQLPLFENTPANNKELEKLLDELKQRFGEKVIMRGSFMKKK